MIGFGRQLIIINEGLKKTNGNNNLFMKEKSTKSVSLA